VGLFAGVAAQPAAVEFVAHLQYFHHQRESHGQIDIPLGDVPMDALEEDGDADGDQKRQGQNFKRRMVQDEFGHLPGIQQTDWSIDKP